MNCFIESISNLQRKIFKEIVTFNVSFIYAKKKLISNNLPRSEAVNVLTSEARDRATNNL